MTAPMPGEGLPATRLDEARAELYAATSRVWVALGWPAERATPLPTRELATPSAWVDVPVLHQSPTENGQAMSATFPVVFVTDGSQDAQVRLQDKLLAHAWHQLARVKLRGYRAIVQSGGPEDVDTGRGAARGLVFRVQIPLQVNTLCPQPLVQESDEEGTTP